MPNVKKFLSAVTEVWVQTDTLTHTHPITRFTTGIGPVVNNKIMPESMIVIDRREKCCIPALRHNYATTL